MPLLSVAAATALALLAILIWQSRQVSGHKQLAISLVFGTIYFLYRAEPKIFFVLLPLVLIAPFVYNRAIRAGFELSQRHIIYESLIFTSLLLSGILAYISLHLKYAEYVFNILALALFLEPAIVVWLGLSGDLVDKSRKARLWFLGLGAVLGLAIALASIFGDAILATSLGAFACVCFCFILVGFGSRLIQDKSKPNVKNLGLEEVRGVVLDDRDQLILKRLRHIMAHENLSRDPSLSLSRLAQKLDIAEHRLRHIIHNGEGFKHFNIYLNGLRINDFKGLIVNSLNNNGSILDMALKVGYNSLSAFNRAFKAIEGETPSQFRSALLAARKANNSAKPVKNTDADKTKSGA